MDYRKIETYYSLRHYQFESLSDASDWFEEDEEQHMWCELLCYADAMYEAKQIFNTFSDAEIEVLLDGRVPLFIVEMDDDTV